MHIHIKYGRKLKIEPKKKKTSNQKSSKQIKKLIFYLKKKIEKYNCPTL
jgi:hypothetical protein